MSREVRLEINRPDPKKTGISKRSYTHFERVFFRLNGREPRTFEYPRNSYEMRIGLCILKKSLRERGEGIASEWGKEIQKPREIKKMKTKTRICLANDCSNKISLRKKFCAGCSEERNRLSVRVHGIIRNCHRCGSTKQAHIAVKDALFISRLKNRRPDLLEKLIQFRARTKPLKKVDARKRPKKKVVTMTEDEGPIEIVLNINRKGKEAAKLVLTINF